MFFRGSRYEHIAEAEIDGPRRAHDPLQAHALHSGSVAGALAYERARRRPARSASPTGRSAIPSSSGGCATSTASGGPVDLHREPGRRIRVPGPEGGMSHGPAAVLLRRAGRAWRRCRRRSSRRCARSRSRPSVGQASIFRLHFDLSRNIFGDFDALAIDIFRPLRADHDPRLGSASACRRR